MAGGVALAATWDTALRANWARAWAGMPAPAASIFCLDPASTSPARPSHGRNFEYLSEDPFLNAAIVVPFIEGVQSQGVIATVKHYALNNQEYNRHNVSVDADERTMREIYLPAFEAAVTKAHVDAVMNSYNLINGVHATQNEFLNLKVLKGEWDFKGVLMSDWDATYDGVAAANNGLDLEMPSPRFMNAKTLLPAIKDGTVKESTIDDKVLRLLRTELRYGFTDRPQLDPADSTYSVADRPVALQGALESITLLKNEGHILPLDRSRESRPSPSSARMHGRRCTGGGGSSEAQAFEPVSIVTGIANLLAPDVHVLYSRGLPEMNEVFRQHAMGGRREDGDLSQQGLHRHAGDRLPCETSPTASPKGGDPETRPRAASATRRHTRPPRPASILFWPPPSGEDDYKVFIDGKQLMDQPHAEGQAPESGSIDLNAGQTRAASGRLSALRRRQCASASAWPLSQDMISADVKQFASAADVVVVAVGFNPSTESEGSTAPSHCPGARMR